MNISRFGGATPSKAVRSTASSGTEAAASFEGASALDNALSVVPDVRPEAVARARELIADPNYPSNAQIKTLSNFLAQHLLSTEEQ